MLRLGPFSTSTSVMALRSIKPRSDRVMPGPACAGSSRSQERDAEVLVRSSGMQHVSAARRTGKEGGDVNSGHDAEGSCQPADVTCTRAPEEADQWSAPRRWRTASAL